MSKKRIALIIVLVIMGVVILVLFAVDSYLSSGPSLSEVLYLRDPRIVTRDREKVISITLEGKPGKISGQAIRNLHQVYKELPIDSKTKVAPKARWSDFDLDSESLKGEFAMTVPYSVTEIPEGSNVELKEWEYGEVAEILHVGAYKKETQTIEMLKWYIEDQGYEISGEHEEEYLKGPGLFAMFGIGSTGDLLTVIRYQVEKK